MTVFRTNCVARDDWAMAASPFIEWMPEGNASSEALFGKLGFEALTKS
jgi:hypothetical protein